MAIMQMSKENFTCLKEQISLYLLCLTIYSIKNSMKPDINYFVNSVDPDHIQHCFPYNM